MTERRNARVYWRLCDKHEAECPPVPDAAAPPPEMAKIPFHKPVMNEKGEASSFVSCPACFLEVHLGVDKLTAKQME